MYAMGIRVQVPAGSDTDLEHIAARLRTHPPSAVLKEQSLPCSDHAVVAASHLLVNRAHALGLAGVSHARCSYSSLSALMERRSLPSACSIVWRTVQPPSGGDASS